MRQMRGRLERALSQRLAVYEKLRRLTMPITDKYLLMVTWGKDGGTLDIIEHLQNMFSGDPTKDW